MMENFNYLELNLEELASHLFCDHHSCFLSLFEQRLKQLTQTLHQTPSPQILLVEKEPIKFIATLGAIWTLKSQLKCQLFLGNPDWGQQEWEQVFSLVHPDLILGEISAKIQPISPQKERLEFSDLLIMIPTGGTSGKIRFVMHSRETLTASVIGFQEYFQVKVIHSFCVLPLYHVSGLMQILRSFTTKGNLVILPFKDLEQENITHYNLDYSDFFISLVPTQLQRLLNHPHQIEWLSLFRTILLGGAPSSPQLLEIARNHHLRIAPTYGMTETASQIATLKPDDFLQGYQNSGQVLPHAQIIICDTHGKNLGNNILGKISIKSQSLALGYYPTFWQRDQPFQPDDLGLIDTQGYLEIMGRISDKIITGGENVFPIEVESVILATGLVKDVCVIGIPDERWGQKIIAFYVPIHPTLTEENLSTAIRNQLSKFKQPKSWIKLDELPRNLQGKINREQLILSI